MGQGASKDAAAWDMGVVNPCLAEEGSGALGHPFTSQFFLKSFFHLLVVIWCLIAPCPKLCCEF